MSEKYPEKTCDITRLVMHPKLVAAVLAGQKTAQRRNGVYAYPGETFELAGVKFEVTGLFQQQLRDMTDDDARAEGYESCAAYRDFIMKMHNSTSWNDEASVWVHTFKRFEGA
jgi:hypothetical protein